MWIGLTAIILLLKEKLLFVYEEYATELSVCSCLLSINYYIAHGILEALLIFVYSWSD